MSKNIRKKQHSTSSREILAASLSIQLWPRNWSAFVQLTKICAESALIILDTRQKASKLSASIKSQEVVQSICETMITSTAQYPMAEDYLSEVEWGATAVYYNSSLFRVFYGGPYDTPYEYWQEYLLYLAAHPDGDHTHVDSILRLQNDILTSISVPLLDSKGVSPGHLEVPPINFIRQVIDYLDRFEPRNIFTSRIPSNQILDAEKASGLLVPDAPEEMQALFQPFVFISDASTLMPLFPVASLGALPCHTGESIHLWLSERQGMSSLRNTILDYVSGCGFGGNLIRNVEFQLGSTTINFYIGLHTQDGLIVSDLVDGQDDHSTLSMDFNERLLALKRFRETHSSLDCTGETEEDSAKRTHFTLAERQGVTGIYLMTHFLCLEMVGIDFEPEFQMLSLPSFLGIIAEAKNDAELWRFLQFYSTERSRIDPFSTPIDCFFLFREFYESIESGATQFDMVSVDPHWGTSGRFASLKRFIEITEKIKESLHPDHWRIISNEQTAVRIAKKRGTDFRNYLIGRDGTVTQIRIADEFVLEAGRVFGFVEELIEDVIKWFECRVGPISIPLITLRRSNDLLGRMGFTVDSGQDDGVVFTFNLEGIQDAFSDVVDRNAEWKLLEALLAESGMPAERIEKISDALNEEKLGKPRFIISSVPKEISFPEEIDFVNPEDRHFKDARKNLAIAARSAGCEPGIYELVPAKAAINSFRDSYYTIIREELSCFPWHELIQILLQECGARSFDEWMDRKRTKQSLRHDVSYDREKARGERHEKFIQIHRNIRLLIEMVNCYRSKGQEHITKEDVGRFIAMADWFHVIQSASDMLHYGLERAKLKLDDEFVPEISYPKAYNEAQERFRRIENSERILRLKQPGPDLVDGVESLVSEFSVCLKKIHGFRFEIMLAVLDLLSRWGFINGHRESPIYCCRKDVIANELLTIVDAVKGEALRAIDWLILDHTRMKQVQGENGVAATIPVWESKKRPFRYTIRPVVSFGEHLIWEPVSCYNAKDHWMISIFHGQAPVDFGDDTITAKIGAIKRRVEANLEAATFEEFRQDTPYLERNLDLAKRFKSSGIQKNLGDFDVLGFFEDLGLLVSIECKDLNSPYCIKDARRFRDKLYGREFKKRETGYYDKAERRGLYLKDNWRKVLSLLGWPQPAEDIEIINAFVVPRLSLWHFYGPREYFLEPHSLQSLRVRLQQNTE